MSETLRAACGAGDRVRHLAPHDGRERSLSPRREPRGSPRVQSLRSLRPAVPQGRNVEEAGDPPGEVRPESCPRQALLAEITLSGVALNFFGLG